MSVRISSGMMIFGGVIIVGSFLSLGRPGLAAQPSGVPSKEDIIDALGGKDSGASRGFVQSSTGATAKPKPTGPITAAPSGTISGEHASIGVPILFDINSSNIKPISKPVLNNIAAALQSPTLKDAKILLEGHTDATGSPDLNMELSQQRAMAVREYLVKEEGVPSDRLSTIGKGQSEPISTENPTAPENRRVVLVNLSN